MVRGPAFGSPAVDVDGLTTTVVDAPMRTAADVANLSATLRWLTSDPIGSLVVATDQPNVVKAMATDAGIIDRTGDHLGPPTHSPIEQRRRSIEHLVRTATTEVVIVVDPGTVVDNELLRRGIRLVAGHEADLVVPGDHVDGLPGLTGFAAPVGCVVARRAAFVREAGEGNSERLWNVRRLDHLGERTVILPGAAHKVAPQAPPMSTALDDITFVIPVRIDSADRARNLDVVVDGLRSRTQARIIVGTDDPASLPEGIETRAEVVVVTTPDGPFLRTRIANQVAPLVRTKVLALHDADVIVPTTQLVVAVAAIDDGADLILPHDGTFLDVPWSHHGWMRGPFEQAMPLVGIGNYGLYGQGGSALWRTDSYFTYGMENEHFVGWGCQDGERLSRARGLGATVLNVSGPCFHLHHWRGRDSREDATYAANRAEWDRVRFADPDQLRAEVADWPWRVVGEAQRAAID